jgi:hypothetical protein
VLLSQSDDKVYFEESQFGFEVKNGKFYFTTKGEDYQFGTKLYPLGSRGHIFHNACTEGGKYLEVAESIERSNWKHKTGYCYTFAEIVHKAFLAHGIKAKYFSGWVFTAPTTPIHHAWVVVEGNVYDIAVNVASQNKMREQVLSGIDPYSPQAIKEIAKLEENHYPIVDNFTWGKVEEGMIYIGSENTPNGARLQYNKAVDYVGVENHPSYRHMKKGQKYERSPYQKILAEAKGEI